MSPTPVLFLHGYTDSRRSWDPVLPYLPSDLEPIVPTQRGHGDAERPDSGYAVENFAADAVRLLDELEIASAPIVGHSMGAWVAERVAIDHPERVTGLLLEGAFAAPVANEVLTGFGEEVFALEDPVPPEFAREFQLGTLANPISPELLDTVVAESLKLPAWLWKELYRGFLEVDYIPELATVDTPALLVWGDQDAFVPRSDQDQLLRALANARLEVYEGTGHAVHWEQPERFAREVANFVRELAPVRTAA